MDLGWIRSLSVLDHELCCFHIRWSAEAFLLSSHKGGSSVSSTKGGKVGNTDNLEKHLLLWLLVSSFSSQTTLAGIIVGCPYLFMQNTANARLYVEQRYTCLYCSLCELCVCIMSCLHVWYLHLDPLVQMFTISTPFAPESHMNNATWGL